MERRLAVLLDRIINSPAGNVLPLRAVSPSLGHVDRQRAPQKESDHRHALEMWIKREVTDVYNTRYSSMNIERLLPRSEIPWQGVNLSEVGDRMDRLDHG